MIKMIDWKEEGLICPVTICDICGMQINKNGTVLWKADEPENFVFVHKTCDRPARTRGVCSRELGEFLNQLGNNFRSDAI